VVQAVIVVQDGFQVFKYYTQWAFCFLIIYFGFAAYFSARGIASNAIYINKGTPLSLVQSKIIVLFFQLALSNAILVVFVLWGILVPWAFYLKDPNVMRRIIDFYNFSQHGANLVLILIELFINRIAVYPKRHIFILSFSPFIFTLATWAAYLFTNAMPYPFMDLSNIWAPAWYVGIFAIYIASFALSFGVFKLKIRCCNMKTIDEERVMDSYDL